MTFVQTLPLWILFAVLAAPLTRVALNSRKLARETESTADYEPKTTAKGPLIENGDGTFTQTITASMLSSISATRTENFGPVTISVNAREWAANAVLIGLLLALTGLVGLLHFPTGAAILSVAPPSHDDASLDRE